MGKVPASTVATAPQGSEIPLPAEIEEALGELVGAAREGLLALSVGVGLGLVHEVMALEVDEVVAARAGTTATSSPSVTGIRTARGVRRPSRWHAAAADAYGR